ncbi:MAG: alpha/beta hydrolase [Acaryochloridaceae cyanobacterium CSU_5_19]|nr:alpha/beta hydrolase [Acaryochloridaceae cyanobacterium CSU_5_19]
MFRYGSIARSIPVSSLRQLANTGQAPSDLQVYLDLAGQDPQSVRQILTRPFAVKANQVDQLLNSPFGDVVLGKVGEIIRTPANRSNREAIRSALVLDASQDGQVTLIDTLEKYPTATVEVDGERLLEAYQQYGPLIAKGRQIAPALEAASPLLKEAGPLLQEAGPILQDAQPYLQRVQPLIEESGILDILSETLGSFSSQISLLNLERLGI